MGVRAEAGGWEQGVAGSQGIQSSEGSRPVEASLA